MTEETIRIIDSMRKCAGIICAGNPCPGCYFQKRRDEYGFQECRNYVLRKAADMIEKLSAENSDLITYAGDKGKEADILAHNCQSITAERNEWKHRAEAAEKDLHMLRQCRTCAHDGSECAECEMCFDDSQGVVLENWKWRGLCAENGGLEG